MIVLLIGIVRKGVKYLFWVLLLNMLCLFKEVQGDIEFKELYII